MSSMPRVLSDIHRIGDTLVGVEEEMASLAIQLRAFDQRNIAGVEDLSRLDTLKSNMEKCKATLEEHARWSQLVREAKGFLEGGGRLVDSADRCSTSQQHKFHAFTLPGTCFLSLVCAPQTCSHHFFLPTVTQNRNYVPIFVHLGEHAWS